MKKTMTIFALLLICATAFAQLKIEGQELKILLGNAHLTYVKFEAISEDGKLSGLQYTTSQNCLLRGMSNISVTGTQLEHLANKTLWLLDNKIYSTSADENGNSDLIGTITQFDGPSDMELFLNNKTCKILGGKK